MLTPPGRRIALLSALGVRAALAVSLYRSEALPLAPAAQLSQVPLVDFTQHVSRPVISVVRGDAQTLREDIEARPLSSVRTSRTSTGYMRFQGRPRRPQSFFGGRLRPGRRREQEILEAVRRRRIEVLAVEYQDPALGELDTGEAGDLRLAVHSRRRCLVLIDERAGCRVSREWRFASVGMIGLRIHAKRRGLVPAVRPALEAILAKIFGCRANSFERYCERQERHRECSRCGSGTAGRRMIFLPSNSRRVPGGEGTSGNPPADVCRGFSTSSGRGSIP